MSSDLSLTIIAAILALFMLVAAAGAFFIWMGLEKLNRLLWRLNMEMGPKAIELHGLLSKAQRFTSDAHYQLQRVSSMASTVSRTASRAGSAVSKPLKRFKGPDGAALALNFLAGKRKRDKRQQTQQEKKRRTLRLLARRLPRLRTH